MAVLAGVVFVVLLLAVVFLVTVNVRQTPLPPVPEPPRQSEEGGGA